MIKAIVTYNLKKLMFLFYVHMMLSIFVFPLLTRKAEDTKHNKKTTIHGTTKRLLKI